MLATDMYKTFQRSLYSDGTCYQNEHTPFVDVGDFLANDTKLTHVTEFIHSFLQL